MMFQSSCVLGLWMLVAVPLCQGEIEVAYKYGQELCPRDANVNDMCHDGAGTCKMLPSEYPSCVPSDCGKLPAVQNGQFEVINCFDVYTCATLVCDDGYLPDGGDTWMQCWFDGWSNGLGAPVAANCSMPVE